MGFIAIFAKISLCFSGSSVVEKVRTTEGTKVTKDSRRFYILGFTEVFTKFSLSCLWLDKLCLWHLFTNPPKHWGHS